MHHFTNVSILGSYSEKKIETRPGVNKDRLTKESFQGGLVAYSNSLVSSPGPFGTESL